jgi:hypothetical protein
MKNIFLALVIGFILFSSLAKAESIYQYEVTAEIYSNNTVHYKLNIVFVNHTSQNITIPLGSPVNIQVESSAVCKEQRGILQTDMVCSMKESERTTIAIQYDSNSVSKRDSYFLFADSFKLPQDAKTVSILIKLPEGTGLREPTEDSYSPTGALIGSDGRRPIINWVKYDLKADERFDVSIAFEKIGESTGSFPPEIFIIIILISFSGLGIFYQFYWKGKNIRLILPVLKKDEKKIFDTIMKHGNGVNQKIIVKDSGYSKAKVSKVLSSLKERRLVKLERIGRSNKVYIEKNFEKKS